MPEGTVIVTGASRGIGAAIATDLAGRGYAIAGISRSGKTPAGDGIACDLTDESALKAAIGAVAKKGKLVGLVNNAGVHSEQPSAHLPTKELEDILRLNTVALFAACRETYPHLQAAGGGLIVNIGSFFDKMAVRGNVAYNASKAAVGAITRCLATEWARDGIRVMNVAPGYIETDLNREYFESEKVRAFVKRRVPVGRSGTPEEVARLVGALFAGNIGFLTGETIYIDGGQGSNL